MSEKFFPLYIPFIGHLEIWSMSGGLSEDVGEQLLSKLRTQNHWSLNELNYAKTRQSGLHVVHYTMKQRGKIVGSFTFRWYSIDVWMLLSMVKHCIAFGGQRGIGRFIMAFAPAVKKEIAGTMACKTASR